MIPWIDGRVDFEPFHLDTAASARMREALDAFLRPLRTVAMALAEVAGMFGEVELKLDAPVLRHVLWHPVELRASRYPVVRTQNVHRDVKPQNLVQRRAARAPGPRPRRARAWCRARRPSRMVTR